MNTKSIDRRRFLAIGTSALAVAAAIAAPRARAQAAKGWCSAWAKKA